MTNNEKFTTTIELKKAINHSFEELWGLEMYIKEGTACEQYKDEVNDIMSRLMELQQKVILILDKRK